MGLIMTLIARIKEPKVTEIDVALEVLCITAKRDETLTTAEIAEVCGCSQSYISEVMRSGIKKLKGSKGLLLREFI